MCNTCKQFVNSQTIKYLKITRLEICVRATTEVSKLVFSHCLPATAALKQWSNLVYVHIDERCVIIGETLINAREQVGLTWAMPQTKAVYDN